MNTAERIELLKAVAECAPKEMGCVFLPRIMAERPVCLFKSIRDPHNPTAPNGPESCLSLTSDYRDAIVIVAMLDAMEGVGWIVSLDNHPSGAYRIMAWRERDPGYTCAISTERVNTNGKTRAEAVARAFVKVFGGKA